MGSLYADQVGVMGITEKRNVCVSYKYELPTGDLLAGSPTVVQVGGTDMVVSSISRNATILTYHHETVGIAQAVVFSITGGVGVVSGEKRFKISCATSASPPETLDAIILLVVQDEE